MAMLFVASVELIIVFEADATGFAEIFRMDLMHNNMLLQ